jgi:mRNA interferase MazF
MKKFIEWNDLKIDTDKNTVNIKIREGEIRWCRFGVNIGHEIIGKGENFRRPVLILKKFSGDVFLGCPLTSKKHDGDWYFNLDHEEETRCIILNQARLLDRKRLEHKMYELNEVDLKNVKEAYCKLIVSDKNTLKS